MGSKCSTIVCSRVALPSRKADPISVTPTSTQKPSKRSSVPRSRRFSRTEEQSTVIENCRSPEYLVNNNPSKNKGLTGETSTDDALRRTSFSHTTEPGLFQYKKGPLIGKGSYGEVYECLRLNTGELLAVKSFKLGGDTNKAESYIEKLKREVQQLRDLSHNNIVKYFTVDVTEAQNSPSLVVDIILEYVSGGSVRGLLDKFSRLEEKVVAKYIRQVLDGLVYLHDNGIIHRNIKGSNILIDTTGLIKLTDFGGSGRPDRFSEDNVPENPKASTHSRGPAYWSAPEVVLRKAQGKPADVWSVGCVVIEMLTGSPPWRDQVMTMNDFSKQIAFGTPPTFPNNISESCRDFLYKTLKFKPEDRPTVLDLLDHPFVKEKNQDSSYMEAESIQAEQDGKGSPERVLDLLGMDNRPQEKRVVDPKKNNFLSKYSTDELSINGLTIDAYNSFGSTEFAGHILSIKDKSHSRVSDKFEKDPNFFSVSKKSNLKHREVSIAASNEKEEGNPVYSEQTISEMKTGVILRSKNDKKSSNPVQDSSEAESKEAIRRRIEEEMNRDLMLISGQLSSRDDNEFQPNEYQQIPNDAQEDNASNRKKVSPIPIQNSFFSPGSPSSGGDSNTVKMNNQPSATQFLRNKTGERKQSWKMKSSGGIIVKDADNLNQTKEDTASHYSNLYKRTSENAKKVIMERVDEEEDNDDTQRADLEEEEEAEMKRVQERLRKQYEEQMEMSLARLNSENLQTIPDKEGEPDASMWTSSKMSPQIKQNLGEDETNQIIKIAPVNLGNVWRIDDSGPEPAEVSDSKSNNWRGHEDSLKGTSPQMTESEGRSPTEKHTRKKISEFAKFNVKEVNSASLKNDSFEKIDNLEEVQQQSYEVKNSPIELRVEVSEGNREKLGIINEEIKEDSLYDDEMNTRGGFRPQKA